MVAPCTPPSNDAPGVELTLVGAGEPLIRLEKRLHCAAAGLGLRLMLTLSGDVEALGMPYARTPVVLAGGKVVLSGLPRTEDIEAWLRTAFIAERGEASPR